MEPACGLKEAFVVEGAEDIHMYIHIYIHIHAYIYIYTHIHTHVRTHIHTYLQSGFPTSQRVISSKTHASQERPSSHMTQHGASDEMLMLSGRTRRQRRNSDSSNATFLKSVQAGVRSEGGCLPAKTRELTVTVRTMMIVIVLKQ